MLNDVKAALRIDDSAFDLEVQDLIDAAKADLQLSGVSETKVNDSTDSLIKRAIIIYCRAHFDYDDKAADKLLQSYVMLKTHLTLTEEYSTEEIGL
ncbi:MAG: head-tail connector protein [Candidatus Syntrophopropionicum ammoniitolerans]|jgi:uncharacterized phage protein (predicted DNA packaging)